MPRTIRPGTSPSRDRRKLSTSEVTEISRHAISESNATEDSVAVIFASEPTASGLVTSAFGADRCVERSKAPSWKVRAVNSVALGSSRHSPVIGLTDGVNCRISPRNRNHHTKLVSPSVANRVPCGSSDDGERKAVRAYRSVNPLQASAVPSPRKAQPATCWKARPVSTTPTTQHTRIATANGAFDAMSLPSDVANGSPGLRCSTTSMPATSAGASGQVRTLAADRALDPYSMLPSSQQVRMSDSGTALSRRPGLARSWIVGPRPTLEKPIQHLDRGVLP